MARCDHAFVWLRQEIVKNGYGDYTVYDVFVCQRCLEYRWVELVRKIDGRAFPARGPGKQL